MPKPQYDRDWRKVRLLILRRDGYRCQIQGPGCTGHAGTVDHITSLHQGGARLDPANLQAACGHCNYGKGNRDREPRSERWY